MTVSTVYRLAAEMSTRGNLPAGVSAANKQLKTMQVNLGGITSSVSNLGRSIGSGAFQTAAAITKGAAGAGAAAAGAAAGMMAKSGLSANANAEAMRNTLAGTLQLYNHSAGAADQIGANIKVAAQAMRELNKIADSSPGELEDVSKMFQNMLPGARSVTGDMARIMRMTQNLALFTPTLTGGDFITSGSQMGRILTGSAGAEMDTWKRLAPVILDVGQKMDALTGKGKVFSESMEAGEKLTLAFNKLSGGQRMALIEKAFERGGPALAAMYKQSWEGASATAISSGKKVVASVTAPIFARVKAAAIRHTSEDNSLLGANRTQKMMAVATSIGNLLAGPVDRALEKFSQGFRYVQENTYAVINRIYQGFQVAGGIIRGAAAFMLSRMIIGAGLMATAAAAQGAAGAVKGVSKAYGVTKEGIQSVRSASAHVSKFFQSFKGGPITSAMTVVQKLSMGFSAVASAGLVLIPMLVVAGAALGALSLGLLAAGGIAAYIASKWSELTASISNGFATGAITVRPLVIAVLILWERMKKLGESFIGGISGATMMQGAINMATSAVNGLSEGVAVLAEIAATFLQVIAAVGKAGGWMNTARKGLGMGGLGGYKDVITGMTNWFVEKGAGGAVSSAIEMRDGTGGRHWTDKTNDMADRLTAAAKSWRATDIKNINPNDITSWTDSLTATITDAFKSDDKEKKVKKGPSVAINNLYQNIDLRGEDPDRTYSALITPIENLARTPTASGMDTVGGMGG